MAEKVTSGLVQYIALRGDLLRVEKWPIGAIVAQACHASAAVLHQFKDDPNTQQYFKNVDSMRKVVLEVSNYVVISNISNKTVNWIMVSRGHVSASNFCGRLNYKKIWLSTWDQVLYYSAIAFSTGKRWSWIGQHC